MGRSDVALMVRQAALHVWKVIVQNTARTLRDIMPVLFSLLLGNLASTCYDKRQVRLKKNLEMCIVFLSSDLSIMMHPRILYIHLFQVGECIQHFYS